MNKLNKTGKIKAGDIVQVVASGIQGEVVSVNKNGLYEVKLPGFSMNYTRPMLKLVISA